MLQKHSSLPQMAAKEIFLQMKQIGCFYASEPLPVTNKYADIQFIYMTYNIPVTISEALQQLPANGQCNAYLLMLDL